MDPFASTFFKVKFFFSFNLFLQVSKFINFTIYKCGTGHLNLISNFQTKSIKGGEIRTYIKQRVVSYYKGIVQEANTASSINTFPEILAWNIFLQTNKNFIVLWHNYFIQFSNINNNSTGRHVDSSQINDNRCIYATWILNISFLGFKTPPNHTLKSSHFQMCRFQFHKTKRSKYYIFWLFGATQV